MTLIVGWFDDYLWIINIHHSFPETWMIYSWVIVIISTYNTVNSCLSLSAEVRRCDVFVGQAPAPWVWYPLLVGQWTNELYWGLERSITGVSCVCDLYSVIRGLITCIALRRKKTAVQHLKSSAAVRLRPFIMDVCVMWSSWSYTCVYLSPCISYQWITLMCFL